MDPFLYNVVAKTQDVTPGNYHNVGEFDHYDKCCVALGLCCLCTIMNQSYIMVAYDTDQALGSVLRVRMCR